MEAGIACLEVVCDIECFYDAISISLMSKELLRLDLPPWILRLVCRQYPMPRRTRLGMCLPAPLLPERSALAGCGWAGAIAKGVAYAILEAWHSALPDAVVAKAGQYVDDVVLSLIGEARQVARCAFASRLDVAS